jgi:hypothetical protein
VKAATQGQRKTDDAVTNSEQKTDFEVDVKQDLADQAKGVSTAQSAITVRIDGFVLVPGAN